MANRRFLITATGTGAGKTTVACALAAALAARGMRVGVMKPVETGCYSSGGEMIALDAIALRAAAKSDAPLELVCPFRYASPLAPAAAADLESVAPPDLARIQSAFDQLAGANDAMIVEGAGGITVPITWDKNYADLALMLDLELIVVVPNRLGCLNGAVLTLDYAERRGLKIRGYVLNHLEAVPSAAARTNAQSLRRLTTAAGLGEMPYRGELPAATIDQLIASPGRTAQ